jgi:hypothetical protein
VALGAAILGEPLTVTIVGSFALILVGSVLATWGRDKSVTAPTAAPPADPGSRTRSTVD